MTKSAIKIVKHGLKYIKVPGDEQAQKLLINFKGDYGDKEELIRIRGAKALCKQWKIQQIKAPFPGISENNDYWYLIQLYALSRHIHNDSSTYFFDLSRCEEIYVENFVERDWKKVVKEQNKSLFTLLQEINGVIDKKKRNSIAREHIDMLIKKSGDDVLDFLGFDTNTYRLSLIPFDIYLRISHIQKFGKHAMHTHFDGYRKRLNGELRGLYGGSSIFGGAPYIDSLWNDTINQSIIVRLVILRKDYGKK